MYLDEMTSAKNLKTIAVRTKPPMIFIEISRPFSKAAFLEWLRTISIPKEKIIGLNPPRKIIWRVAIRNCGKIKPVHNPKGIIQVETWKKNINVVFFLRGRAMRAKEKRWSVTMRALNPAPIRGE